MNYNFDEIINRKGTDSVKWDAVEGRWGRNDLIPMWVADMDFRTAPFVIDALKKRLEHEVLGYTFACKEWAESIINWLKERHGWTISEDMLTFTPGIVRGLAFAIHCFTEKGDKVMVMPPVYHPFFLVTQKNEREVVFSPLILKDGQYHIDFNRFRKDVQGCKLLVLSNPHNPGGRVWTKEELSQIADICYESGTLVISDEIHADLTLPPYKHSTFALCLRVKHSICRGWQVLMQLLRMTNFVTVFRPIWKQASSVKGICLLILVWLPLTVTEQNGWIRSLPIYRETLITPNTI